MFNISVCSSITMYNCSENRVILEYLWNHELKQKWRTKGRSVLLGNDTWLCRNLLHSCWKEGFDKLINLSFFLLKCFCHSNLPLTLKLCLSPLLAEAQLRNLCDIQTTVAFCVEGMGQKTRNGVSVGPERCRHWSWCLGCRLH